MSDVTRILEAIQQGDGSAADELLPLVYDELRRLAAHKMANERPGQTLQPTALVHEAWLRLTGGANQEWNGRGHFFAAAAEAMRRILVENARRKRRGKHGGELQRVDMTTLDVAILSDEEHLLAVDEALEKLAARDPLGAQLIKLRFFAGLPNVEAARLLEIPERTAKRTWAYARAWLYIKAQCGCSSSRLCANWNRCAASRAFMVGWPSPPMGGGWPQRGETCAFASGTWSTRKSSRCSKATTKIRSV